MRSLEDRFGATAAARNAATTTYIIMEGPQFSSLAESELYRSWTCDVIGMTNMPEAKLARASFISGQLPAQVTTMIAR